MFLTGQLAVTAIQLNMTVTTLTQGMLIIGTLKSVGSVGAQLLETGFDMILHGNFDAGFAIYEAGARIFQLAAYTTEVATNGINALGTTLSLFALARAMVGFVRV